MPTSKNRRRGRSRPRSRQGHRNPRSGGPEWTVQDVENVILDVRTIGVGGFPSIIDDETWIGANANQIAELGPREYLRRLVAGLHAAFTPDTETDEVVVLDTDEDADEPLEATFMAVGNCDGCGGGLVVLMDENTEVFAQAHFPTEPANWLEDDFIPALRNAAKIPPHTRH